MNKIIIFADGGCRGNGKEENIGSYGATLEYKERTKEIKGAIQNTTNNIMELTAVIQALNELKLYNIPIEVNVDSAYVLNGITSWIKNWKKNNWRTANKKPVKNKELWIKLDSLVSKFDSINFIKVKGHTGNNDGNDRADILCNEAMDELELQLNK